MKQYHGTYACFFLFHVSDDRALCKPGCASLVVIHWYSWRFWWWLVMFVFIDLKWPRVFRCSTPSCYIQLSAYWLPTEYHIHIWQVSPRLSCGDTCKIWMWFKRSNLYCHKSRNVPDRKNIKQSFSNPHPWSAVQEIHQSCCKGDFCVFKLLSSRIICRINGGCADEIHWTHAR